MWYQIKTKYQQRAPRLSPTLNQIKATNSNTIALTVISNLSGSDWEPCDAAPVAAGAVSVTPELEAIGAVVPVLVVVPVLPPGTRKLSDAGMLTVPELAPKVVVVLADVVPLLMLLPEPDIGVVAVPVPVADDPEPDVVDVVIVLGSVIILRVILVSVV